MFRGTGRAGGGLVLLLVVVLTACADVEPPVHFVGDANCASCHGGIVAEFAVSNKGQAVSRFVRAAAPEVFDADGFSPAVYDPNLDFYYQAFVRGDSLFQQEFRLGPEGDTLHLRVHAAQYVIGSGNATRSYLMQTGSPHDAGPDAIARGGYVTQMPLTWYSERAMWGLSPGFEVVNDRFSRPMNLSCITCHSAPPEHSAFTQNHFAELAEGISCESCHGPASAHVAFHQEGIGRTDPLVRLAALDRPLQLATCQSCHLEGYAVFAEGEDMRTYRPGMPLEVHRRVFVPEEQVRDPERFGVGSHAVRLAESACFIQSVMTCTTCHDPHRSGLSRAEYNASCQSCHGEAHETVCSRELALGDVERVSGDCVSCHMQTGAPSDIPHVSFTDHWIRRELPEPGPPPVIEVVMTRRERVPLVDALVEQGQAVPRPPAEAAFDRALARWEFFETKHPLLDYLPEIAADVRRGLRGGADRVEARVVLGRALMRMDSLAAAEAALAEAHRRYPEDAFAAYWLGRARTRAGRLAEAVAPLDAAVRIQPLFIEARVALAEALAAAGREAEARDHLEAAVAANPEHHPEAWNNLGLLHLQAGRTSEAVAPLERAVALAPDFAEARTNLGSAYLLADRLDAAAAQFEAAVRLAPEFAPAHGNLGLIYLRQGRTEDARRQFARVLALDPRDAQARAYLDQLR